MTCKHPITGEADGFEAQFLIDRGLERYTYFLGPLDSDGTYWEFDNTEVRACKNVTIGRTLEAGPSLGPRERAATAPAAAPAREQGDAG